VDHSQIFLPRLCREYKEIIPVLMLVKCAWNLLTGTYVWEERDITKTKQRKTIIPRISTYISTGTLTIHLNRIDEILLGILQLTTTSVMLFINNS
jgi:hypothetical protein